MVDESSATYGQSMGARNTALQTLVVAAPPPLVAELLGYSYNVAQWHAEIAAQPWWAVRDENSRRHQSYRVHQQTGRCLCSHDIDANPVHLTKTIGHPPLRRFCSTASARRPANTARSNTEGYRYACPPVPFIQKALAEAGALECTS